MSAFSPKGSYKAFLLSWAGGSSRMRFVGSPPLHSADCQAGGCGHRGILVMVQAHPSDSRTEEGVFYLTSSFLVSLEDII